MYLSSQNRIKELVAKSQPTIEDFKAIFDYWLSDSEYLDKDEQQRSIVTDTLYLFFSDIHCKGDEQLPFTYREVYQYLKIPAYFLNAQS